MIDPPVATSLGLPEGYVEALGTSRQSSARMTLPIYSNSYTHISQSPSTSALDSTLNVGGESRAENILFEETAVEGSKGEAASSVTAQCHTNSTNMSNNAIQAIWETRA